jgi:hypothetical protein
MKQLRTTVLPGVQILPQICEKRGFRLGVQIMLVVIFSALAAAGKVIHPSQGIPGSSSLYWLAPMMLGMTVMRWPGAGVLTGISMGCWGIPFGMEHTFGYNVALYGSTGLLIDLITRIHPGSSNDVQRDQTFHRCGESQFGPSACCFRYCFRVHCLERFQAGSRCQ